MFEYLKEVIGKDLLDIILICYILDDEIPKRIIPKLSEMYLKFLDNDYLRVLSNLDDGLSLNKNQIKSIELMSINN